MTKQQQQTLARLAQEVQAAAAAGDHIEEAAARGRMALIYLRQMAWAEAAAQLARVAELAEADNQPYYQAQVLYSRGRALGHLPERRAEARDCLQSAADLSWQTGQKEQALATQKAIAEIYLAEDNYQQAVALTTELLQRYGQDEAAAAQCVTFYRIRAVAYLYLLQFEVGAEDLAAAAALTQTTGDEKLAADLRVQHHSLASLAQGDLSDASLSALLIGAHEAESLAAVMDVQLKKAVQSLQSGPLQSDRIKKGLRQAEDVLAEARQAPDMDSYGRYLLATLLIAQAQDSLGNRVGVLTALLRGKVYLESHLGLLVSGYMDQILDSFGQQWGPEGLQQAIQAYQQHVAEQGPIQA